MEVSRLNYNLREISDAEPELGLTIKRTLNVNDLNVLSFRIPADGERFSDLNTILLAVEFSIVQSDGKKLGDKDKPFIDFNGISSLFSSCDVKFDGEIVSTMGNYAYSAALCRWLGMSSDVRANWNGLDGAADARLTSSDLTGDATVAELFAIYYEKFAKSATVTLVGRIYSDVLLSSRQYLPPDVELGIDLRRAPDAFSICCNTKNSVYRIKMDKASVYVKRLSIKPNLLSKPLSSLKHDAHMFYNKLDSRICSIPKGQTVWRWLDCLNGAALPNRIYVAFVNQESLYGTITRYSTFFETLNLSSFNVKLNGKDIMTEPITASYVNTKGETDLDKSNAKKPYLALLEIFDNVKDQLGTSRFNSIQYMQGKSVLALELGKCGEKSGSKGTLDLEVEFSFLFAFRKTRDQFFTVYI